MATIGTLVVEMRANAAQFHTEMSKAKGSMTKAGDSSKVLKAQLSQMAAKGFGEVIPGAEGAGYAITKFAHATSKAGGALGLLGPALLVIGAGFAAFKIGKMIGEWLALGTSVENYKKQAEEAAEAQKKLNEQLSKERDVRVSLDKDLANLKGDWKELIRLEQEARDARIRATFGPNEKRNTELAKSSAIAIEQEKKKLEELRQAREKADNEELQRMLKQRDEQAKIWQQETQDLIEQLKARLQARQQFEAQLGNGAEALGVTDSSAAGSRKLREAKENLKKALRDLAFQEREGGVSPRDAIAERQKLLEGFINTAEGIKQQFAGVPSVIDAVNQALINVQVAPFSQAMQEARDWVDRNVDSMEQLKQRADDVNKKFQEVPLGVDLAVPALRRLQDSYTDLAWAVHEANVQMAQSLDLAAQGGA